MEQEQIQQTGTEQQPQPEDRRSFLRWAIYGMSAVFAAVLGAPAVAYLIDSRNRKGMVCDFQPVDGVKLSDLQPNQPKDGIIRNECRDAWTLHPNDIIGRVWVVKYDDKPASKDNIRVFTTVCPHLGCSIQKGKDDFVCPCHGATFELNGDKIPGERNPAPRGMDKLAFRLDEPNNRILVEYRTFQQEG